MPNKEPEYKTHKENKHIPPGVELVPFHWSGQPTHYFLRYIGSKLLYSSLMRNDQGQIAKSYVRKV